MKRWFEVNEIDPPSLNDDLGDVGDFEEPPEHLRVRITSPIGTTIGVGKEVLIERTPIQIIKSDALRQAFDDNGVYAYRVVDPPSYKDILIARDSFEIVANEDALEVIMNESVDDLGDVGDFERPITPRPEIVARFFQVWRDRESSRNITEHTPLFVAEEVALEFGCPLDDVCLSIRGGTEPGWSKMDLDGLAEIIEIQDAKFAKLSKKKRKRRESVDDLGDVGDFEEPTGIKGQQVIVRIPDEDWDEAIDKHIVAFNGQCGSIFAGRDSAVSMALRALKVGNDSAVDVAFSNVVGVSCKLYIPLKWLVPLKESADDFGDVGDFEEPPVHSGVIVKLWSDRYHGVGYPLGCGVGAAAVYVAEALGCSKEEVCRAIETEYAKEGRTDGRGIAHSIRCAIAGKRVNYLDESVIDDSSRKEMVMEKKKKWYEANEVDPESGYIREVPDAPSDLGDVGEFEEPESPAIIDELESQPTYYDAWKLFSTHYREFNKNDPRISVPSGSGAFEMWWVGGPTRDTPFAAPSPQKPITKEDIDKLATEGDYQGQGAEVFGLFMNTFYNNYLGAIMDLDTLTYLTQKAMKVAMTIGGEEQFDTFELFQNMDEDDKLEIWGTRYAAVQIANQIKRDATAKLKIRTERHRQLDNGV